MDPFLTITVGQLVLPFPFPMKILSARMQELLGSILAEPRTQPYDRLRFKVGIGCAMPKKLFEACTALGSHQPNQFRNIFIILFYLPFFTSLVAKTSRGSFYFGKAWDLSFCSWKWPQWLQISLHPGWLLLLLPPSLSLSLYSSRIVIWLISIGENLSKFGLWLVVITPGFWAFWVSNLKPTPRNPFNLKLIRANGVC